MLIRPANENDADDIWRILAPVIAAGETYALPRDFGAAAALGFWHGNAEVFVAEAAGRVVGTYYLRPNQRGGGAHVANCGFVTAAEARGRGVARAMCAHSLDAAGARGFRAMQFNFVVSTNIRAVRLWEAFGFVTLARLPDAFLHPALGFVDALVMWRRLGTPGAGGDQRAFGRPASAS